MATSQEYTISRKVSDTEEEIIQIPYGALANKPDLSVYQTKTDASLKTNDKTVVGAINEVVTGVAGTLESFGKSLAPQENGKLNKKVYVYPDGYFSQGTSYDASKDLYLSIGDGLTLETIDEANNIWNIKSGSAITSVDGLGGGAISGNVSTSGSLTVGGSLTVNGTTTTVDSTTLQVKDKLIEVAHGNTTKLTTPAGLVAPKYDGTNSGALVFDGDGTAYVGDVTLDSAGNIDVSKSELQPLATRTGLVGGNLVQYDSTAQTLKDSGKKISDLATTSQVNAKYTKPSGGIPKTDLASSVQTSLGKADTALQSHQDLSNYVTLNTDQNISGQKKFSHDFGIWANYGFRAFQDEASLNSYTQGVNTIKNSVLTGSGVTVRTDGTSYSSFRDGYIRNQKSGAAINITLPTKEGTFALTSDIPDVSGKLDKTAYEENKTINFGNTGVLKIGKFKVYDTNVTCEITSTTSLTYSGKLVIATQNNVIKKMTVYGDAENTIAPNIFVKPSTASDPYIEVYFKPSSWSKNVIHIYGSAIMEAPTDVCTNVAELPSVATEKPINALTYLAAGDGGYSLNASGYVKGSWLQSSAMSNKGSNTGKVCVFDDNGWIYYRTPTEILAEAGGGVGGGGITPFCMDDLSTGTFSSTTLGRSTTTTALYFEDRETSVYGVLYGGVYSTTKLYYLTDVSYSTTSSGSKHTFVFTKYTTNNDKLIKSTDKIELVSSKATYSSQTSISGTFYYKILK